MAETHKTVTGETYKDTEIPVFYKIVLPLLILVLLIGATQADLLANILMVIVIFGFSYFGWPIKATVTPQGYVIFRSPLRTYKITPDNLKSVKLGGLRDSRVQIILRTERRYSINYRIRKFENAPELAKAVLNLVEQAPNAKVSDDAVKLLRKVTQGKTPPPR